MVRFCVFPKCTNKMTSWTNLSFHRLPLRNLDLLKAWLDVLKMDPNTQVEALRRADHRVCSVHFAPEDFFPTKAKKEGQKVQRLNLRKNAIPMAAEDTKEPLQSLTTTYKPGWTEFESGTCSVVGCDSSRRGAQRFKLPQDPERRLEWVQFLFEVNTQGLKESCWTDITICSEHFTDDCFEMLSPAGTSQLKPGVVPSLRPIKSEPDEPLESPQSVEMPTGNSPGSAGVSVTVPFSDEEGNPSDDEEDGDAGDPSDDEEDGDERRMSTDEEWTPPEEVLLAEELAEETDEESAEEEEAEFDSPESLKIKELCTECGSFFNSLKGHTCEHKIKPYSCNICGKRCVTEIHLKIHSRVHEETYEHPCKYCHAPFRTRIDKLKHEQIHQEHKDPYQCPDCPETFSTNNARRIHLSNHRVPKVFKCGVCGIEFKDVHHLRRHSVVHTGLRPYKCSVCQRAFSQGSHLKSHMRLHTGEKPYKCQHCDKCFNHNVSLKSHVQRYHTSSSGFARRKGKIDQRASVNGKGNENRRGTDSEIDNMEEAQDREEEVHGEGIDLPKRKGRTNRPRGRPKRAAAGELILSGQNKNGRSKLRSLQNQSCSRDNSSKSSGKHRGRPKKEIVV